MARARSPAAQRTRTGAFWAPRAWLGDGWRESVLLRSGPDGIWTQVQSGVPAPAEASVLAGPVLPGLVNAHSHCFQRAFAGLAERRDLDQDDFWSWRDRMYRVAQRVTEEQQKAIAAQLFLELLRGGYTHVCEFHYLHNGPQGAGYPPGDVRMARAIAGAAADTGIGLTLLPTVYERAGFGETALRPDQQRFAADVQSVLQMRDSLRQDGAALAPGELPVQVGLALHSLRAVRHRSIEQLIASADDAPIHIHVSEQMREVQECEQATGLRPIEWLCRNAAPDRRWHLVHATHADAGELAAIAACGAGVVLCPSTEANLGDGITDLPGWLRHGVPISLGTDSHVTRSAMEELRSLEYAQRLAQRLRCVAAAPQQGEAATAARLFARVLAGGGAAAGFARWGLQTGARADLLVIDTAAPALLGVPDSHLLDALVFSSPIRPFRDVLVAGRWATRNHQAPASAETAARFAQAMRELWKDGP